MILIISGTNKKNSNSRIIAKNYLKRLEVNDQNAKILCLDEISFDFIKTDMYSDHSKTVTELQTKYFNPANKFIFIIPEYNGSIPGILKLLIDSLEVKDAFQGKKATMVGVATGRAGNLRGIDHLLGILQHMLVTVMPGSLPISSVSKMVDSKGNVQGGANDAIEKHIAKFIRF